MKAAEASAMIEWLVAMGADEVIGSTPVNRLIAPRPAAAKLTPAPIAGPKAISGEYRGSPSAQAAGSSDAAQMAAVCTSLAEIEQVLTERGLHFGMDLQKLGVDKDEL